MEIINQKFTAFKKFKTRKNPKFRFEVNIDRSVEKSF